MVKAATVAPVGFPPDGVDGLRRAEGQQVQQGILRLRETPREQAFG